jgi:hypothetical protein
LPHVGDAGVASPVGPPDEAPEQAGVAAATGRRRRIETKARR